MKFDRSKNSGTLVDAPIDARERSRRSSPDMVHSANGVDTDRRPSATKAGAEIRVTGYFPVSPERAFHAWLDPTSAGGWLFATASRPMISVDIDPRRGGSFCFVERRNDRIVEHRGEYLAIVPHRSLEFTLSLDARAGIVTRVRVAITPRGSGCVVTLTHEHVPPDLVVQTRTRWVGILYGLETLLA